MKSVQNVLQRARQLPTMFVMVLVFGAGFAFGNHNPVTLAQTPFTQPAETEDVFEPFWQVYDLIHDQFVPPDGVPIPPQKLVDGAIRGMVETLNDQNSGYMDAEQYPVLFDDLSGTIEGIGVVIRDNEDTGGIEVANILEGTPAAQSGIKIGDIFAVVDGEDVLDFNQIELAAKVRGPAGTTVSITMLRDGERIDFDITRERIDIPNLESRMIGDTHIGYIKLNEFTSGARAEIDTALEQLHPDELNGLIIDFRGNPGGLLTSAIDVASAFVEDGPIVIEDFGSDREQIFRANGSYEHLGIPLVVLVDERSASASELVAGALQDVGAATIIGETTFGKGTVQTVQQLVNGGGLRLTIARWLTPNRHWIHGAGITPDIEVDWDPDSFDDPNDPQLAAAVDHLQSLTLAPVE
ncbi:MAG: S41 family peptidase [Anaerolineae bacterium]|nr:S41 family peptidase [Anaerolineae bacterium]